MAWFKKGGDTGVVDLADFQRRGIFKPKAIPKKSVTPTDSQGYADLSKLISNTKKEPTTATATSSPSSTNSTSSEGSSGGFFDFFGNLRSNASKSSSQAVMATSGASSSGDHDGSTMKNRVNDVEFKIENISRKLNNFLERIELMEKKINRLEGKGY